MRSRSLYAPLVPENERVGNLSRHMHMMSEVEVVFICSFCITTVGATPPCSDASCAGSYVSMRVRAKHDHVHEEEGGEGMGSVATGGRGGIGDISIYMRCCGLRGLSKYGITLFLALPAGQLLV